MDTRAVPDGRDDLLKSMETHLKTMKGDLNRARRVMSRGFARVHSRFDRFEAESLAGTRALESRIVAYQRIPKKDHPRIIANWLVERRKTNSDKSDSLPS